MIYSHQIAGKCVPQLYWMVLLGFHFSGLALRLHDLMAVSYADSSKP